MLQITSTIAVRCAFTLSFLRQKLDILCGEDGYRLDLRPNDYFLLVKLELSSEGSINEVRDLLERNSSWKSALLVSLQYLNRYIDIRHLVEVCQNKAAPSSCRQIVPQSMK